jgi:methylthioribose-1-phosphate isomerase
MRELHESWAPLRKLFSGAEEIATEADTRIAALEHAGRMALRELEDVLASCNAEKVHFDGDDFHEALEALRKVLTKPCDGNEK